MTLALPLLLEDPRQRAPLEERVEAALALGVSDPRLGQRSAIAAGSFLYGSDDGAANEHPLRRLSTGAYEIGVVPVTVSEFAPFVPAGYRERAHWDEEGWAFLEQNRIDRPRFWGDPAWSLYQAPSQPVVGVSWHEARAFARSRGLRLPGELEWERAARGEDGRAYPWGSEWREGHAHFRGGTRSTLPVGCFPGGRSQHGLLDASGNIWEWTEDALDENSALRVARGGGWNAHPPQLRCANRNAWPKEARFSNLGFRLAR